MKSIIESVSNLRSYDGFETRLGTIKSGSLFRGGHLGLMSEQEKNRFAHELNIKQNIDFRTSSERSEFSDPTIQGVENIHLNVLGDDFFTNANPDDMASQARKLDSLGMMLELYSAFPSLDHPRQAYIEFFNQLAQGEGALYFHCTAGKDRTGFGGAMLLRLLGANDQAILNDFLLSNAYRQKDIEAEISKLMNRHPELPYEQAKIHSQNFHGVQEAYLKRAWEIIDRDFGGVEAYLANQLYVSPDKQEKILARFLK